MKNRKFNFTEFNNNIQKDLIEAKLLINEIEKIEWEEINNREMNPFSNETTDFNKDRLIEVFDSIKLKMEFAYDYIGLSRMMLNLDKELKELEGKFALLKYIPYADVFYSPVLWTFQKHISALTSHMKIDSKSEYENTNSKMLLEQILRGTAKMLTDRKIEPANEAEVRSEVYKTLIHVFPDTVREIPIAKVSKTYKPDIGVKRLKSAIEYKFVDSKDEAKVSIGGVFEDIQGYEGSSDWTTFYAVIYMTDNFLTQDQVEAEFKLSKVPHHWKPIVVFGKGGRKK
jgi:REase_DpnII-MboI